VTSIPPAQIHTDTASITEMLRLIVGPALEADPGSRLITWSPRRPKGMIVGRWGSGDLDRAVAWALELGTDIYFDTAPVGSDHVADLSPTDRGRRDQRASRYVVALDLDHADAGGHKGECLPSKAEAEKLIAALPVRPSIVVDTGGGFHAYWLTEDPISDPGRQLAGIADWWVAHVHPYAPDRAVVVSPTQTLRVPGTWRTKSEPHLPVQIVHLSDARFTLAELNTAMPGPAVESPVRRRRGAAGQGRSDVAAASSHSTGGRLGPVAASAPVPLTLDVLLGDVLGWRRLHSSGGGQSDWQSPTSGVAGDPGVKSATVYTQADGEQTLTIYDCVDQDRLGLEDQQHRLPAREVLLRACCGSDLDLAERALVAYAAAQDGAGDPRVAASAWVSSHLVASADIDPKEAAVALLRMLPPPASGAPSDTPDDDMPTLDVMVSAAEAVAGLGRYVGEIPGVADSQLVLDRRPGSATVKVLMPRRRGSAVTLEQVASWAAIRVRQRRKLRNGRPVGDPSYDVVVFDAAGSVEILRLTDEESTSVKRLRRHFYRATKAAPAHAYALENITTALVEPEVVTAYGDTGFVAESGVHRWCGSAGSITATGIDREVAAELPDAEAGKYVAQHGWPEMSDAISVSDAVRVTLDGLLAVVPTRPELAVAMLATPAAAALEPPSSTSLGVEGEPGAAKTLLLQVIGSFVSAEPAMATDGASAHVTLAAESSTARGAVARAGLLRGVPFLADDLKTTGEEGTDRAAKKIASQLFSAFYGGGDSSKLNTESELQETTAQSPRTVMVLTCETAEMLGQSARQRGVALRVYPGDVDLRPGGGLDRWKGLVREGVPQALHAHMVRWMCRQLDLGDAGALPGGLEVSAERLRTAARETHANENVSRADKNASVLRAGWLLLERFIAEESPEHLDRFRGLATHWGTVTEIAAGVAAEADLTGQLVQLIGDAIDGRRAYIETGDGSQPPDPDWGIWGYRSTPGSGAKGWTAPTIMAGKASDDGRRIVVSYSAVDQLVKGTALDSKRPGERDRALAKVALNGSKALDRSLRLPMELRREMWPGRQTPPNPRGFVFDAEMLGLEALALAIAADEAELAKEAH
jgi:putative DNA primase/helicase